jgi:Tol biopolymer transport system component
MKAWRIGIAALLATAATPALSQGLSLQPSRTLDYTVDEATWMQPDLSPDGKTLLIDILGDIYALDATGGTARPLLTGLAYEAHPVFSPDGTRFAFISDRSGVVNLWVADADGSNPRQISQETSLNILSMPAWSPDGKSLYVSHMVHRQLAFELWKFDAAGPNPGEALTKADAPGWDDRKNVLGVQPSPDGKTLYYAFKTGHTWTENDPPNWSIARYDIATKTSETLIEGGGGAMTPALSHDGRFLAYASRAGKRDELRLRDLTTGEDRRIYAPLDRDAQEQGYYAGLTPRILFTPDNKHLLTSIDGKLVRISVADGIASGTRFTANLHLGLGPQTHVTQREETGPVRVRVIQAPTLSPDGTTLAFTALGSLYVQKLTDPAPHRLPVDGQNFQPAWSPDGRSLAYVSWTRAEGGAIWTVPVAGGKPRRLTKAPAFYTEPAFSPDGRTIAALQASHYDRVRKINEIDQSRATDLITLPTPGGTPSLVTHAFGARQLQWAPDGQRLRYTAGDGIHSLALDGSDNRIEAAVVAQAAGQYVGVPVPPDEVQLSPDGKRALVRHAFQISLIDLPAAKDGKPPKIDLTQPDTPAIRLTRIGADFASFTPDGQGILWSAGSTLRRIALADIDRSAPGASEAKATSLALPVTVPRDVPTGSIVLRGATVLPMQGDSVIPNADVVITDNRIVAVGPSGSVAIPEGAKVRDVSGKFITPGFVDTHAHWFEIRRKVHDLGAWDFGINLAFGVTSGLEVQPFTSDIFAYQDMIDAGMMPGPRAYTTGPGIFRNSPGDSAEDVAAVLTRFRDEYRTRNIKAYMVGDRARRQYMVEAAKQVGMMPTTEGASDMPLGITHFLDGFSGNEHAIPVAPLRQDMITLMAKSGTSYTPTLGVLYGGAPALFDMIIRRRPQDDPRIQHFMPPEVLAEKLRNRRWTPEENESYAAFAADALKIQRAGGLVGMGSHGEVQGLGYLWELICFAGGGATPMEVLHAATIGGARVIGRDADIGSLEPGKLADLLILDADPLANIENVAILHWVMKNGRLYDPMTLKEAK